MEGGITLISICLNVRFHGRHRHRRHVRPVLHIRDLAVQIPQKEKLIMATSMRLDQALPLSIAFADAAGNPIPPPAALDSPPVWTSSDASVAVVTASADGLTAVVSPLAEGPVSISLVVMIGGAAFNATADVLVTAAAVPAVASISIVVGTASPV